MRPAPSSSSPTAFPSGAYAKYKRATAFFLHWLECAGGDASPPRRKKTKKTTPKTLDDYARMVAAIAVAPTLLPAALRRQWPRAMAACECAITLRAQVARFYAPKDANDPHMHFLNRLVAWFRKLRETNTTADYKEDDASPNDAASVDFANYYDVLDLPDDFFDDGNDKSSVVPVSPAPSSSSSPPKSVVDEDDGALELAYFLLELDELSEDVYNAFCAVKTQEKTLVEATLVVHAAVDFATRVIAHFQLQQPTITNAKGLFEMISDKIPIAHIHELVDKHKVALQTGECGKYLPGTILLDVLWIISFLSPCARDMPAYSSSLLGHQRDDEPYDEDRTPHYTRPWFIPPSSFFYQQLPPLFNAQIPDQLRSSPFINIFLHPVLEFFKTREVTIELLFVWTCWVRSVSALQGNGDLSRTISRSLLTRWDLEARLQAAIDHGRSNSERIDERYVGELTFELKFMRETDDLTGLTRANPIVAGDLLLTHLMEYLRVGMKLSMKTTRLWAFCHMYSALHNRRLLTAIPFFEYLIALYEDFFFPKSRATATFGSFARVYATSVKDSQRRERRRHNHKYTVGPQTCRCLKATSGVNRLLDKHEYFSELPHHLLKAGSWQARLDAVAKACHTELLGARLLSRDLLQLTNDLADLFGVLRKELAEKADTRYAKRRPVQ